MKSINVTMKDGRKFSGVSWGWKPDEGYFTIAASPQRDCPNKIFFRDVENGTRERSLASVQEAEERNTQGLTGNPTCDVLEYARQTGWDGT